jgi:hypothetical protein
MTAASRVAGSATTYDHVPVGWWKNGVTMGCMALSADRMKEDNISNC